MANRHCIEYARTGRAKCTSPTCKEIILKGGLRFGTLVPNPFDPATEVFRFYHWDCTPTVVMQMLKDVKLEAVAGWNNLQPDDKKRLKDGIARVASAPAHGATSGTSITPGQNPAQPRDSLSLRTSVVGTQYWQKAAVTKGEKVRIVRTPKNKVDNNACNVATTAGDIFGSVPHGLCTQISPLLDRKEGDFTVEGTMLEGHAEKAKVYELAMELKLTFPLVPAVRNAIPLALVHAALQYGSTAPIVEQRQAGKRARAADDSSDEEPLHKRQRQGPASSVDAALPAEKESPKKRPHVPSDILDKLNRVHESSASAPSREPVAVDAHGQIIYGARPSNGDPRFKFTHVPNTNSLVMMLRWWPGDERECFFDVVDFPNIDQIFDRSTLPVLTFRVEGTEEDVMTLEEVWENATGERVDGDRRWCAPLGSVLKCTFQRKGMDRPATTSVSCPFTKDRILKPYVSMT